VRRLAIAGILAAAVFAVGIGVFLGLKRSDARTFVLPDGVRVELLGTSQGSQSFTTEKSWERLARKHLPGAMTKWIAPASGGSCSSGSNSLTVYLAVHDPTGVGGQRWTRYVAEDDTGFRYNAGGSRCGFGGGGGGGTGVSGLILTAFPRRQKSFWLRLLDANDEVVGSLRVPNPFQGPFPQWKPESLPQTKTNGPVTLKLIGLWKSDGKSWHSANPRWQLSATEPAWTNAHARNAPLSDATGNQDQWLSPAEPAWKVRTRVYRRGREDFGPGERFVLTNVAVPRPGELTALDQTFEISGVQIIAHVLAGAGRLTITNNAGRGMSPDMSVIQGSSTDGKVSAEYWGSREPFLHLEAMNLEPEDELFFHVTDESGREIAVVTGGYGGTTGGRRIIQRKLAPGIDVRSINVEVALNRPRIFEFLVDPAGFR
jgi:hypothetical protein